jgi:hypothetical protein
MNFISNFFELDSHPKQSQRAAERYNIFIF